MKIVAIRGRNLASLEGNFAIDFTAEPLASAGIFAISGPTGAGKSTLLDAMCLALFARTPRTEQAKENNVRLKDVKEEVLPQSDPRFLLRRGTVSGYAEVDFIGLDGQTYRARWSVGRARDKENGRLQNARLSLINVDKGVEEQGTRSELQNRIIELIGLTFEQFTRSVLLAQNDFSTFLKAEQSEKASLLEKLTGTELYSTISRIIYEKNTLAKEALEKIQVQIQGIDLLSDESVLELQRSLEEAEKQLLIVEKSRAERQTLQDTVKSSELFIKTKEEQRNRASEVLAKATELHDIARKEFEVCKEEEQKKESLYKVLQPLILQARKLDVRIDNAKIALNDAEIPLKEVQNRLREGENKLKVLLDRLQGNTNEIARIKDWQERYREKENVAEQLSTLLLHLDIATLAYDSIEASKKNVHNIDTALIGLDSDLKKAKSVNEAKRKVYGHKEKEIEGLIQQQKRKNIEQIEKDLVVCREKREQLLIEQALYVTTGDIQSMREKLLDNHPCPVCGSLHHPYVTSEGKQMLLNLAESVNMLTKQMQVLSEEVNEYNILQRKITASQQQQMVIHKEITEKDKEITDIVNRKTLLVTQKMNEEMAVKEQSEKFSKALEAVNLLFGGDKWQTGWMQDADMFRSTLTSFVKQWSEYREKLQQLERQQSSYQAELVTSKSYLSDIRKQMEEALALYEKKKEFLSGLQMERTRLLDGNSADIVEQEYLQQIEVLKDRLVHLQNVQIEQSRLAEQSHGVMEQIVKDLSSETVMLEKHRVALDKWIHEYEAVSNGLSLEKSWEIFSEAKSEIVFKLKKHTENQRKMSGLLTEFETCRAVSDRWAKLNELAGSADGAKFRRIAQGYTLDVLLNYANIQLRGLTHRYRLERVPDTLALQVIDQDMCDEVRTVHTLSGGESFLVSLALALGLSALSSNRMKVESLFIDEGFGSLDTDTLRVAMDALENLRTQGRKIGVISHVQEMTERIPVQIKVKRSNNGRSILSVQG